MRNFAALAVPRATKQKGEKGGTPGGFYRGPNLRRGLGFGARGDRTTGRRRAGTGVSARA
jgi:hypothetical protein